MDGLCIHAIHADDKSHPLRLGSFEGLVQLRHGQGREGQTFLD